MLLPPEGFSRIGLSLEGMDTMHEWRNPLELGLPGGLIAAVPERRGGRRKQRSGQTKPVRSIGSDARGTRMIRRRYPSYAFGSIAQSLARAKHSTSVLPIPLKPRKCPRSWKALTSSEMRPSVD